MEHRQNRRSRQTHERLRAAAFRLFLRQGYLATSIDAILAEAGISSKETLYRHYASKEELFVDVLSHLTLDRPGFAEKLSTLPTPHDLSSLHQALTQLSREILSILSQPEYLALLRIIVAEAPRFPQLGRLFFSNVPQRGFSIIGEMLQAAKEQRIIAEVNFEAVTRALIGGLLSYALLDLMLVGEQALSPSLAEEQASPPLLDRADAIVEVIMRAVTP
jgi:AcrR family transcriptional regulator